MQDYTNKIFGDLKVLSFIKMNNYSRSIWNCVCLLCNKQLVLNSVRFLYENKKDCGCKESKNAVINTAYRRYKRQATQRKLEFNLTKQDLINLIFKNCYYCNESPSNQNSRQKIKYNGIDRLNNKIGYNLKNCVPACYKCNRAKSSLSLIEFYNLIQKIYEHSLLDKNAE